MNTKPKKAQPALALKDISFPVVGIGASAGGLQAIGELLKYLPANTGMAFIVIQHLAPSHESMLSELLSRETEMPVHEIQDGMMVKPNHIYVIPPNSNLGILHGSLNLIQREKEVGQYLPIDFFFRSLAREQSNHAIGIILSGSASDGVMGLMEIKAEGGITFAQDQDSATFGSMPHSAVAAGCVDFVLSPDAIAQELTKIGKHPYARIKITKPEQTTPDDESSLRKVFLLLRQRTGNDFTYYKQSTILRRLKRRILLNKLDSITDYAKYLQKMPEEVDALSRDLLINVTSFFRDPEVFEDLQKNVFPVITKGRMNEQPIRIWVPGCSTGEEVYSIAISLIEFLGDMVANTKIQLFATDLDGAAVNKARVGIYADSIEEVVSKKRLQHFFTKVDEGYQIAKNIREFCVFAQQNVFGDPPFSRMDLISCRNLLIYLSPVLQQKIMPIFHYALNIPGYLLLGTSESVGRNTSLFKLVDKKNKLYEKKLAPARLSADFTALTKAGIKEQEYIAEIDESPSSWTNLDIQREADRIVLKKFSPCGVVINEDLNVLQFRGHTGDFLEPAAGEANLNLLKMARSGLQIELRNAIKRSVEQGISVHKEDVRLAHNGEISFVDIYVDPIQKTSTENHYFLISFHKTKNKTGSISNQEISDDKSGLVVANDHEEVNRLENELVATKEYMNSIIEQQEVSNEELTSANEEIQASNEELQSTNEELETAKEELQSSNEELATVNDEMESRNNELELLSNDLSNLITGLSIPIVMVNNDLHIRRFSPEAEKLLNLISADIGRPITHIKANIAIPDIEKVLLRVVDSVASEQYEIQDDKGYWYEVYIHPYKTEDNRIDGAIISFIDINAIKLSLDQEEWAKSYAESIVSAIGNPMLILDKHLRVISASDIYYRVFSDDPKDTIGNLLYHLGNGQWAIPKLRSKLEKVITNNEDFDGYVVEHKFKDIGDRRMQISGQSIVPKADSEAMVLMEIEDITDKFALRTLDRKRLLDVAHFSRLSSMGEMASTIAHEINQPLAAISVYSDACRRMLLSSTDNIDEVINTLVEISAQVERAGTVIHHIREFTGSSDADFHEVNINKLVQDVMHLLKLEFQSYNTEVILKLSDKIPSCFVNKVLIEQVVFNIIRNALEAMDDTAASKRLLKITTILNDNNEIEVSVEDSGLGLTSAQLKTVFTPFKTGKISGLGLGLTISKSVIEAHKGQIWVVSNGHDSTTFSFTLPVGKPE